MPGARGEILDEILAGVQRIEAKLGTGPGSVVSPDPVPPQPPAPAPNSPPVSGKHPSDILPILRHYTVMLPTGGQGDPDNVYLVGKSVPNTVFVRPDGGVVFRADVVNGVHSPNSKYVRAEAREMLDGKWGKAAWPSSGPRSLEADLAIDTSHLSARRRCNGIQIHNGGDDVGQLMLHESQGLGWMHKDGKEFLPIDPAYRSGTRFTAKVSVEGDRIKVAYNGRQVLDFPESGSGWYWKIGCYSQTGGASEFKEPAGSYAEVVVWRAVQAPAVNV